MEVKVHGAIQTALVILQPVIPTLPVSPKWQPSLHALAAGINGFLGIWNHYKTPSGGNVSDLKKHIRILNHKHENLSNIISEGEE